ncbi:MAG: hypothetical protein E6R13_00685 [Spirochaetes bacterium]|nr:MAG: hypothetical protein E6R13_00685 [Spirochaetota bacterium]
MVLPLANFPTISFDEANPLLKGMQTGQQIGFNFANMPLQLKAQLLANKINEAKAQYAPQMELANLQKTQAQTPYIQAQTGLLNKDIQWYDPKTRSALALQGAQAGLDSAEASMNRFKMAHPGYMVGGSPAMFEYLKQNGVNVFDQSQPQPTQQPGQVQTMPGQMQGSPDVLRGTLQPGQTDGSGMQSMPSNIQMPTMAEQAKNIALYGKPLNPVQEANINAYREQQKKMADYSQKTMESLNKDAQEAQDMDNLLDAFKKAYDSSSYKGYKALPVDPTKSNFAKLLGLKQSIEGGSLDNEQRADMLSAQLQRLLASRMGNMTNGKITFSASQKINRGLEENAMNEAYDQAKIENARTKEKIPFYNAALSMGYNAQQANLLFNLYNQEKPIFEDGKYKKQNLGQWQQYISPKALQAAQMGVPYSPRGGQQSSKLTESQISDYAKANNTTIPKMRKILELEGKL